LKPKIFSSNYRYLIYLRLFYNKLLLYYKIWKTETRKYEDKI